MSNISEIFGSLVFNDRVMKERLPDEAYRAIQEAIVRGKRLDNETADKVAEAMKEWAISCGATHYTHWFQPMTGITAEKHDSFITPTNGGGVIMEMSGKELVRGEPDASSFPSGGLRATFEARGYTAWDPTSYAFIKEKTLCIPTAYCSYGGEALDTKTPLLRSMEVLQEQALRILKLFGHNDVKAVKATVGPEQEYFLVDKSVYDKRPDLMLTGRTLIGARSPKGQEMNDHYFGSIKPRVKSFMEELDNELWKLGVLAKTEHNETAPAQHELAPVFTTANIAADHNQLTMELMQKIASKHGMVCLLHEKPFSGINGSGKHNNWSLSTDTGMNLFAPGKTPYDNAQFLLFLSAVIMAVDEYQGLLRIAVSSAGNDRRLGGHEAPPPIISIYLGDELLDILHSIENETPYGKHEQEMLRIGAHVIPRIPKDSTDRNRTSPFAFTGNKFEFRMLGSSASVSDVNTVLNTAVAQELRRFADALEASDCFNDDIHEIIKLAIRDHSRILFNGNGYGEDWAKEAERRGLCNYRSLPDATRHYLDENNVRLFTINNVFSETELRARRDIMLENYCKTVGIEVLTVTDMIHESVLPAVSKFIKQLSDTVNSVKTAVGREPMYEANMLRRMLNLSSGMTEQLDVLMQSDAKARQVSDLQERAEMYRDYVIPAQDKLRETVDECESLMPATLWPYPGYAEMLFSVKQ